MYHLSYFPTPMCGGCDCHHSHLSSEETEVEGLLKTCQFVQQVKWLGDQNPSSMPWGSVLNHAGLSPTQTKPLAKVARAQKGKSRYGFQCPVWSGRSPTPPEPQFFLPPIGLDSSDASSSEIQFYNHWQ